MKKIFYFLMLVSIFAITAVNAEDESSREYTVQKGDTLWDISDSELKDNFLWPKLWNVNPQIDNPDLIYPGISITIPSREELMRMTMPPRKAPVVKKRKSKRSAVIVPEIEKKKFLVDRNLYLASGWIDDSYPAKGEIVSTPTGRVMVGQNEMVYINTDNETGAGDRYLVIKEIKVVNHPESKEMLGHQIRVSGIIEVTGWDNGQTKATVQESYENVHVGDGLIPFQGIDLPKVTEEPRTPDNAGYIVESHMNLKMVTQGNIVFVDKGENDGINIGDVYTVFTESPVKRPVGEMQVVSLRPTTSGAVITDSSGEIFIGSIWGKK